MQTQGLKNLGMTCFFSTALQAQISVSELLMETVGLETEEGLASSLKDVVNASWTGDKDIAVDPQQFHNHIQERTVQGLPGAEQKM